MRSETGPMQPGPAPAQSRPLSPPSHPLRTAFGAVLFLAWAVETILWLASTAYEVVNGDIIAAFTAAGAVALLFVLGAMEGLEVSVIDRWEALWPGSPTSHLAGWLAARQLFVAFIVTAATLLAKRTIIIVPATSVRTTDNFLLGVADLTWTTLTVLWFAQIFPKHLGAMNPDRYLRRLRGPLFPVVDAVHRVGVSLPGEWTAAVVENSLDWQASPEPVRQAPEHHMSLGSIWKELRHRHHAHPTEQPVARA